jgi:hypothetical protein
MYVCTYLSTYTTHIIYIYAGAALGASSARGKRDEKLEQPHKRLDVDTVITSASYDAAFLAAGAVIEAVDAGLRLPL